jgi:hypothetical protein
VVEAGFKLLKAFSHLVFIDDELLDDILRSPRGEPRSILPKNKSLCKKEEKWNEVN